MVRRDFIPEGVEQTAAEQRIKERTATIFRNGVRQDFIPEPGSVPFVDLMPDEKEAMAVASTERIVARSFQRALDDAYERLQKLHVNAAIETMQKLPMKVQAMWLYAEEQGQARPAILDFFPKMDPADRLKFTKLVDPAKNTAERRKAREVQEVEAVKAAKQAPKPKAPRANDKPKDPQAWPPGSAKGLAEGAKTTPRLDVATSEEPAEALPTAQ